MISMKQMDKILQRIQTEENYLREAGQKEYAHNDENALANFERVAEQTGMTREQVLMIYLLKHLDGISAWIKGHKSQREDVRGRILDARVYLALLYAMVEDEEGPRELRQYALIDTKATTP